MSIEEVYVADTSSSAVLGRTGLRPLDIRITNTTRMKEFLMMKNRRRSIVKESNIKISDITGNIFVIH